MVYNTDDWYTNYLDGLTGAFEIYKYFVSSFQKQGINEDIIYCDGR